MIGLVIGPDIFLIVSREAAMASTSIASAIRAAMMIALCALALHATAAETWPQRTVRFICPLGPGSGVDLGARLFADRLSARWGNAVVVENHPGGDAIPAITTFINAHDNHTLFFAPAASFTAHPYMHDKIPYDRRDIVPIARVSNTVLVIAVPATLNVGSMRDLVALAKASPGKLNWAGITGVHEFLFAGFGKSAGVNWTKVPYKDPVQAVNDLTEGRVDVYGTAYAIVRAQVLAGKVKLLAVTNGSRAPILPDIPTVIEAGFPELQYDGLVGVFGPRNMTDDLRSRIAEDIRSVADASIAEKLAVTGQVMSIGAGSELSASIEDQRATVSRIAADLGIKAATE
jgi:tripartite-type tricarboxylate transporter receptor subunit TctC